MGSVLVVGGTGMLGHAVWRAATERGEAWASVRTSSAPAWLARFGDLTRVVPGVDVTDPQAIDRLLDQVAPEIVINCAGVIKQLTMAEDVADLGRVNALAPHELAARCIEGGARLVHVSTDCVFSGSRGRYSEADAPDPVDDYGRSKALGEVAGRGVVVLRTSIVGREVGTRRGLLEWFLSQSGTTVKGYTRGIFSGLSTQALASVILDEVGARPELSGTWHVGGEPICKYDLLALVREAFGLTIDLVPSEDPVIDRSLDSSRFRALTGWTPSPWPEMVDLIAADSHAYDGLGESES